MKELVEALTKKHLTIASCESLTGGMFASSIVNISGASNVLVGGLVTYQDKAKALMLDGKEILDKVGAISKEMAYQMASKAKEYFKSNIAISFTGNAGPSASEGKEVGLVYMCLIINDRVYDYKDVFKGNREDIRNECILKAKERILQNI